MAVSGYVVFLDCEKRPFEAEMYEVDMKREAEVIELSNGETAMVVVFAPISVPETSILPESHSNMNQ